MKNLVLQRILSQEANQVLCAYPIRNEFSLLVQSGSSHFGPGNYKNQEKMPSVLANHNSVILLPMLKDGKAATILINNFKLIKRQIIFFHFNHLLPFKLDFCPHIIVGHMLVIHEYQRGITV